MNELDDLGIFYGRDGTTITDIMEWATEREENMRVAAATVGRRGVQDGRWQWRRRYWVSTVYLGIDHNFGQGPPLIFETMIFDNAADEFLSFQDRYATEEQAIAGHDAAVRAVVRGDLRGVSDA